MKLTVTRQRRTVPSLLMGSRTFIKYNLRLVDDNGVVLYDADLRHLLSMATLQGTPEQFAIQLGVGAQAGEDGSFRRIVKVTA